MDTSGFIIMFIACISTVIALSNLAFASSVACNITSCGFKTIFNFGDSNSDTGGLSTAFGPRPPPIMEDFLMAASSSISLGLRLPYLHPYLDSVAANFSTGANFATASSTIVPVADVLPVGTFSPFSLDIQRIQFTRIQNNSRFFSKEGGIFKDLLPGVKYYWQPLYTIDIGQNDIGSRLLANVSLEKIRADIPNIVNTLAANVRSLYRQDARFFWIHNTGPIGCLPYTLVYRPVPTSQMDDVGCAIPYNGLAQYFNLKLKEAVDLLRKDLPFALIVYVDIYAVKYSLISRAIEEGFEKPLVACCGYGGEYNYNTQFECGESGVINDTIVFAGSCENPSVRVNWDGIHYTQAANKWIYDRIATGRYSHPQIPLIRPCPKLINKVMDY